MSTRFNLPAGFDQKSLPDRARSFAKAIMQMDRPEPVVSALLEELATEVELGQRTDLTSRSRDAPAEFARLGLTLIG